MELKSGDIYIMSEYATGYNWKKNLYSLLDMLQDYLVVNI